MPGESEKFDAVAAFRALPADAQERLGAVALLLGWLRLTEYRDERAEFAGVGFDAAEIAVPILCAEIAAEHVTPAHPLPLPDLAVFGIRACRECGCTDHCACIEGCAWLAPDLCSGCGEKVAA